MKIFDAELNRYWNIRAVGAGSAVYYVIAAFSVNGHLLACAIAERRPASIVLGWHHPPEDLAQHRAAWEDAAVRALEQSVE
jgi:hypothetical protein